MCHANTYAHSVHMISFHIIIFMKTEKLFSDSRHNLGYVCGILSRHTRDLFNLDMQNL